MATSHPPRAPSAADIEKVLAGIYYPKTKQDLVQYASQKASIVGQDLNDLIKSPPDRTYRDSAEVAIALGELKSGKEVRTAKQVEETEKPSTRGERAGVASSLVSAATIAKAPPSTSPNNLAGPSGGRYVCELCDTSYYSWQDLDKHVHITHADRKNR
jgi:hypothetical protein